MDDLALIVDLHRDGARQGPGGDAETALAVTLSGLRGAKHLRIADIGCGTGAATRSLARELDAHVTAVDLFPEFLDGLQAYAETNGLQDRIETRAADMNDLPFEAASLDAIWSEGAIYSMGFARGVEAWRPFLKADGILAVSEITWFTDERPEELEEHWTREYPEIGTASEKLAVLENSGYAPIGYFTLPDHCWTDAYLRPLQDRFDAFLARHGDTEAARAIVDETRTEIDLFERYAPYFGYGYYVARKVID